MIVNLILSPECLKLLAPLYELNREKVIEAREQAYRNWEMSCSTKSSNLKEEINEILYDSSFIYYVWVFKT